MKFILLTLFIGVFGFLIITSLLRGVVSFLFGKPDTSNTKSTNRQKQQDKDAHHQQSAKTKKLFDKHEGEYVEYEEIKE